MTTDQSNRLAMFEATRAVLANATETSAIPAFTARFATFTAKLHQIAALEAQQADPLRSQIAIREEALASMVSTTLALAGATLSYADAQGLESLAVKVRFAPIDFDRARLAQKPVLAQHILDAVKTVLPQMGDHGITAAMVDGAQALIEAAATHVVTSRTTVAAKRAATERLSAVFREVSSVLDNQLDPLIAPLAETQPEFHARYRAVREIVSRPATHASANAEATSPAPAAPAARPTPSTMQLAA